MTFNVRAKSSSNDVATAAVLVKGRTVHAVGAKAVADEAERSTSKAVPNFIVVDGCTRVGANKEVSKRRMDGYQESERQRRSTQSHSHIRKHSDGR